MVLPGVNQNDVTIPDSVEVSPTGDFGVRVKASVANWATAGRVFVSKRAGAGTEAYQFDTALGNSIQLAWWDSGGTLKAASVAKPAGISNYQTVWLRADLDVDNGAGIYQVSFYWATDAATPNWTLISVVDGAATTSVRDTNAVVRFGTGVSGNVTGDVS